MKISCIYTITNTVNNKMYVGFTSNFKRRCFQHKSDFLLSKIVNPYLQNAVLKYGIDKFKIEIIEECEERFLTALEHYWATILDTHNPKYGYNSRPTHPDNKTGVNSKRNHKKAVIQYDLKGTKLEEFQSAKEASLVTKINSAHISACCKNNRKTAGSFIWKYKTDNLSSISINCRLYNNLLEEDFLKIKELIKEGIKHKQIAQLYNKDESWVSWKLKQLNNETTLKKLI